MLLFSPKRKKPFHEKRDKAKNIYIRVPEITSFLLNSQYSILNYLCLPASGGHTRLWRGLTQFSFPMFTEGYQKMSIKPGASPISQRMS